MDPADTSGDDTDSDPNTTDTADTTVTNGGESNPDNSDDSRNILIDVPPEQFDKLSKTKTRFGLTWKGMLLYARRHLRREDPDECQSAKD